MMPGKMNSKNSLVIYCTYLPFQEFFTGRNLLFSLVLVAFFSSCNQSQTSLGYKNADNKTFADAMKQPDVIILDVRTPQEYQSGHLPHATLINFYDHNFSLKLDSLDKSKKYLVYCAKGSRSSQASDLMIKKGFTSVLNLKNGFNAWDGAVEK